MNSYSKRIRKEGSPQRVCTGGEMNPMHETLAPTEIRVYS